MDMQGQRRVLHSAYCGSDDDSSAVELEQHPHLADKSRIGKLETTWLQRLLCSSEPSPEALLSTLLIKHLQPLLSAAPYQVNVRRCLP